MARFYYLNEKAKAIIESKLQEFPGHILTLEEEKTNGIYREDRLFGDAIYLLDAGIQCAPSDMGNAPLNGMHGFSPENIHSFAAILSNTAIPEDINKVEDYFSLMTERAKAL